MRRIRSHASYQRELRARSTAFVTGCLALTLAACGVGCGLVAAWQTLRGG